jgi:ATP-dependent Lon protease
MRDFRDAKAMAQTLREALKAKSVELTHSESLELTAKMLGLRNWNVLAARIEEAGAAPPSAPVRAEPRVGLPVLPVRDLVVFPQMTVPLFVGRAKTMRAIERAMAGEKRVLVLAQKRSADDDPGADELYGTGVVAEILQTLVLPDGSMKVMVHGQHRARATRVVGGELLQAEHEPIEPAPAGEDAEELVKQVLATFERRANVDLSQPPQSMIALARIKDPGLLSDILVPHLMLGLERAQELLETADPTERLRKVLAILQTGRKAA